MQPTLDEQFLSTVSGETLTSPEGEARGRWPRAERAVWTARMLNALQTGVKGGRWHSLIDKVYNPANLEAAYQRVARNKGCAGVDHVNVRQFGARKELELEQLHRNLRDATYRPQDILRTYIPKEGSAQGRPLGIPTVRDRVVQTALRQVCEPIFEREFAPRSYGFRPGRGCKDALREVGAYLNSGYRWVVDVDIKSYFDTIPHEKLMEKVAERISDTRVLELFRLFLKQRILEALQAWTPEDGSPQGAVISPLLSNIYLDALDHLMAQRGFVMVRYADDMVILCRSEDEATAGLSLLTEWMTNAQLELHPEKTRLVHMSDNDGFDFLGYHFQVSRKDNRRINHWPRVKSMKKVRHKVRHETPRLSGRSMDEIVRRLNPILRGWFTYFKHTQPPTMLEDIDGWVRMRLRGILRHRRKRRGWATVEDKKRWPKRYFTDLGLFSTMEARRLAVQSSRR